MRKSALLLFIMLLAFTIMPTAAQDVCGDLAARLQAGEGGRVLFTNGDPLNVRSAAGRSADIVARLPEGEDFTVDEDSLCADDLQWWRITVGADVGWIAEGADGVYFVEPVTWEQLAAEDALAERLATLEATFVLVANSENLVLADAQFQPIETFSETYNDGARYRLADADNMLIIGAEDGTLYSTPFDGSLSQLDFSPDNAHFVWADVSYNDENILTDVVFKALDLATGAAMSLRAFSGLADDIAPEDFPQARMWLADDVLLVEHHGRMFALDVTTGGSVVWTPGLPDGHALIGVIRS